MLGYLTSVTGKSNPWTGPEGFRSFRLTDIKHSANKIGKVVSPMHWLPLDPRKYSWYSFLYEAESTAGLQCDQKNYVNEKLQ
jgi:hypothetical protein